MSVKTAEERFLEKTVTGLGCWTWTGSKNWGGYGHFYENGKKITAHRWSYQYFIGPVPAGLHIDHLCGHRDCVNPVHLEAVTLGENVLRGTGITARNARKTHCQAGHEFTDDNTYHPPTGGRICRTCRRAKERFYRENRRTS